MLCYSLLSALLCYTIQILCYAGRHPQASASPSGMPMGCGPPEPSSYPDTLDRSYQQFRIKYHGASRFIVLLMSTGQRLDIYWQAFKQRK